MIVHYIILRRCESQTKFNIQQINRIQQFHTYLTYSTKMDSQPVKARVTQLLGRTGSRGGITQVKVILISGKQADKRHLLRNVKGPVRVGDVLQLMESQRQARRLR